MTTLVSKWPALFAGFVITLKACAQPGCPHSGDEAVVQILKPIRSAHNLPAMAAAIVTSDGLQAVGVVGVRKQGTTIPATLDDEWHLGSATKAMTATLVAKLVEKGDVRWDTTAMEVLPGLRARLNADMKKVTLRHLLSHHAGLPANLDLERYRGEDVQRLRFLATREALAAPPRHALGTHMEYSNLGYIIAGAVIEQVTGKTWERAIQDEVFGPLGMKRVGFGGVGTAGSIDQPWGHEAGGEPVKGNGPSVDNPPVMGPAGRVHSTIQDWGTFIVDQLRGAQGKPALLKQDTYMTLHTPPFTGEYALGWTVVERTWGDGKVFNHTGSNTMNFANVWVSPRRDFAILVCTNQGGDAAFKATDEVAAALIGVARGLAHTTRANDQPTQ